MKQCRQCGKLFSNNEMYCDKCGVFLDPVSDAGKGRKEEIPYHDGYSDLSFHNHGEPDPGNDHEGLYKILIACIILLVIIIISIVAVFLWNSKKDPGNEATTEKTAAATTATEPASTEPATTEYVDEDEDEPTTEEDLIPDDQLRQDDEPVIEDEDEDSDEGSSDRSSEDFIFPDSDSRYLSDQEIRSLDKEETRIAINEIYARKGYTFSTPKWRDYFSQYEWYHPTLPKGQEPSFNKYERENKEKLARYEKEMGWR